jgi:prepilin-type processing-associated H-X9-DG protein
MIEFTCVCGQPLRADDADAGRTTRCPACGAARAVPARTAVTRHAPAGDAWDRADRPDGPTDDVRLPPPQASGKAIAALVLGLTSLLCNALTALPALLFGALAWRDIGRSDGRLWGKPLALAGMLISAVSLLCIAPLGGLVGYATYLDYRQAHTANEPVDGVGDRHVSMWHLDSICIAVHNYHADHDCFPPAAGGRLPGQPPASWRVHLLPYLEEKQDLHDRYNFDEPWDGPNNSKLLTMMPKVYRLPGYDKAPPGYTYYQALVSPPDAQPSAVFCKDPSVQVRFADITDGIGNTIMIAEAATPVPWTKPDDLDFTPDGPLPRLGWHYNNRCHMLFVDGHVAAIRNTVSPATLRALITRNGGEMVNPQDF